MSATTIRHIFISPGHNFYGRYGQPAGTHPTFDIRAVRCRARWGLEGDRFYGHKPDYKGQVTFFSGQTFDAIKRHFNVPALPASVFRRNVIVDGIELNSLIERRFVLGGVEFEGVCEATPCRWMNHAVAEGAEEWLRGQGGLRAKILTDGELTIGPVELLVHAETAELPLI